MTLTPEPWSIQSMMERATAEGGEEYARLVAAAPDGYEPLVLVPVEVFGDTDCCEHGSSPHLNGIECPSIGHGLSDAVSPWSDCNRAEGRVYRVDESQLSRDPGDTVVVYVRREDRAWFDKAFGTP